MSVINKATYIKVVRHGDEVTLDIRCSVTSGDEAAAFINLLIVNAEEVFDVDISFDKSDNVEHLPQLPKHKQVA
jgi:hypothetical protein